MVWRCVWGGYEVGLGGWFAVVDVVHGGMHVNGEGDGELVRALAWLVCGCCLQHRIVKFGGGE